MHPISKNKYLFVGASKEFGNKEWHDLLWKASTNSGAENGNKNVCKDNNQTLYWCVLKHSVANKESCLFSDLTPRGSLFFYFIDDIDSARQSNVYILMCKPRQEV